MQENGLPDKASLVFIGGAFPFLRGFLPAVLTVKGNFVSAVLTVKGNLVSSVAEVKGNGL